jgi:hypothetical protein
MPLQNEPSSETASSFAGLLAALATPKARSGRSGVEEPLDGLQDDVATFSYERALQKHARYHARDPVHFPKATMDLVNAPVQPTQGMDPSVATRQKKAVQSHTPQLDPEADRKRASVTLRMSQAESARLQQRAAEAGLTVSAYLRFCAFEVESLRTQVKNALAGMRAPQSAPASPSRLRWLRLFRPHA